MDRLFDFMRISPITVENQKNVDDWIKEYDFNSSEFDEVREHCSEKDIDIFCLVARFINEKDQSFMIDKENNFILTWGELWVDVKDIIEQYSDDQFNKDWTYAIYELKQLPV